MAATKSLKLLIDTKSNRVPFAKAGKVFVDFLFSILSLPIGTVVKLLTKGNMVGSLGNLYESVENLNETYMQPNQNKDSLLKPKAPTEVPPLLLNVASSMTRPVYICRSTSHLAKKENKKTIKSHHSTSPCNLGYFADDPRSIYPHCKKLMSKQMTYIGKPLTANGDSSSSEGGYVKGVVIYMVMDDLVVKPMPTMSSISLVNTFNVKEVGSLEEKVIYLGINEVGKSFLSIPSLGTGSFYCTAYFIDSCFGPLKLVNF